MINFMSKTKDDLSKLKFNNTLRANLKFLSNIIIINFFYNYLIINYIYLF